MKWAIGLLCVCAFAFDSASAQVTVRVENPLAIARTEETVAIAWSSLGISGNRARVRDAAGKELVTQALDANADGQTDSLLFQVTLLPNDVRSFTIDNSAPAAAKARVHAKFAANREDLAWENDRVAFRTYGKKLWELENLHSNGIDVWMKRTRELITDAWYDKGHDSYHIDIGEGADFYSVGTTLGAGGVGIWNDKIFRGDNFQQHRIIADGPIRAIFELDYLPIDVNGTKYTEKKRISIDAGTNFFRQESTFSTTATGEFNAVVGLVKRADAVGTMSKARGWGWITNWAPIQASTKGHGDLGLAALLDKSQLVDLREIDDHYIAIGRTTAGKPLVSYVGAGWTSSRDFSSAEDWWKHVDAFAQRLAAPVKVTVSR